MSAWILDFFAYAQNFRKPGVLCLKLHFIKTLSYYYYFLPIDSKLSDLTTKYDLCYLCFPICKRHAPANNLTN